LDAECEAHELPFRVQVVWLPTYASWLDQLEIWFSILQRKVLRPNHFPDRAALEQRLLAFIDHYNAFAEPIQWSYTVECKCQAKSWLFRTLCGAQVSAFFCIHHQVAEIQACAYDDPDGASGIGMWRKV
jgi:hypothetical protein